MIYGGFGSDYLDNLFNSCDSVRVRNIWKKEVISYAERKMEGY